MNEKYAILKPDKGSGVVLLSKEDYTNSMTALFADTYRLRRQAFNTISLYVHQDPLFKKIQIRFNLF